MYNPQPDLGRCGLPVDTSALSQMVQNHPLSRSNVSTAHVQPVWSHGSPYFAGNFPQGPPTTQFPSQSSLPKTTTNMSKFSAEAIGTQYQSHPKLHSPQGLPNQVLPDIHRIANLPPSCQGGASQPVFPGFPIHPSNYTAEHANKMAAEYAEKMSKLSRRLEGKMSEFDVGFEPSRDQVIKRDAEKPSCAIAAAAFQETNMSMGNYAVGSNMLRSPANKSEENVKTEEPKSLCAVAPDTPQVSMPTAIPCTVVKNIAVTTSPVATQSTVSTKAATADLTSPPTTKSVTSTGVQTTSTKQSKRVVKDEVAVPPKKRAKALSSNSNEETKKLHHCEQCNKNFSSKWHLDRHLFTHDGKKPEARPRSKCDQCDKTFSSEFLLEKHVERKHSEVEKFNCDVCDKNYSDKFHFDRHYKGHFMNRPYSCEECGQSFTRRDKQKRHMMIHTGEKPHVCEFCDKAFARKDKLRRHVFTHSGDKPFPCSMCDLKFSRKDRRDIHEKVHSNSEEKEEDNKASVDSKESKNEPDSKDSEKPKKKE